MSFPGLIQKPGDGKNPDRVRASLDQVCNVLNSLILSGEIVRTGPATFTLAGGVDSISSVYPPFPVVGSDDEFTATTFPAGWTAVNSGSHLPAITETNNVLSLLMPGSDASGEMHAWMKAPTIAFGSFVEMGFRGIGLSSNFQMAGLLFADGTAYGSGAQAAFYLVPSSTPLQFGAWTDYNTQGAVTTAALVSFPYGDIFFRLVYSAANTFIPYVSADGTSWVKVNSGFSVTVTPTFSGFFASTFGSANPYNWCLRYVKFG